MEATLPDVLLAAMRGEIQALRKDGPGGLPFAMQTLTAIFGGGDEPELPAPPYDACHSLGMSVLAHGAFLRGDTQRLGRLVALLERAKRPLSAEVSRGWSTLICQDGVARRKIQDTSLSRALREGNQRSDVCTVTTQRALALLADGELVEATGVARRASRMARAEGLLCDEYSANLALARVRRYQGMPQLAVRILRALGDAAPAAWHGLLGWESLLAGGGVGDAILDGVDQRSDAVSRSTALLRRTLEHARKGERAEAEAAWNTLRSLAEGVPWLEPEAQALGEIVGLGPASPDSWSDGFVHQLPAGLSGLCVPQVQRDGKEAAAAFIVGGPDRRGRRVLAAGLPLLLQGAQANAEGESRSELRPSIAAAALVLAGPDGLRAAELFQKAFAFPYRPESSGVFRNLVMKTRRRVQHLGKVERVKDHYTLHLEKPCAVPDPRCEPSAAELVLRTLASWNDGASSAALAEALKIPRRTVQAILKGLVRDGQCESRVVGRGFVYRLEDTTFYEPTLQRLKPRIGHA